jgi:aspartate kinase
LKPLQNKQIPLYVKSFFHPEEEGSVIKSCSERNKIPSIIVKDHQTLLTVFPRDFSFIAVENLSELFAVFAKYRIRVNMMQNSALSFSVCTDAEPDRVAQCVAALHDKYKVKYNEDVQLITIRHYNKQIIDKVLAGRTAILRQTSRATIQFVVVGG